MKKLNHLLKQSLKEIKDTYESGYSQSRHLKSLKKNRERYQSINKMKHQLSPYYKPHVLDKEIKKMDQAIDKAIWRGMANNNAREVSKLMSKQHELIMEVLWGPNKFWTWEDWASYFFLKKNN
jgi:tRNA(Met) C34 N-acetyltransferase TmcA